LENKGENKLDMGVIVAVATVVFRRCKITIHSRKKETFAAIPYPTPPATAQCMHGKLTYTLMSAAAALPGPRLCRCQRLRLE
jgi:hypothetical protein